jgi:hypothetical protein
MQALVCFNAGAQNGGKNVRQFSLYQEDISIP